jgi:hypothetical protein
MVSHVLTGFLAVWFPVLIPFALAYQLGQLMFDVRVFPVEMTIRPGNSVHHTLVKLSEMSIGYLIGSLTKKLMGE